jgi:glycosyltransferase involved in cell wall biosynthesis
MKELVILVPVLKRPWRVEPLLESIAKVTGESYRVLFIPDPDDEPEREAIRQAGAEEMPISGNYARKINAGVEATGEPLIFLGADDLNFHPEWFWTAISFLKPRIGVVGTNDICNPRTAAGGDLSTHSLVTRIYTKMGTVDDPTKLLHESYPHEYADQEFIETARLRSAYVHASDCIVEHLHPMVKKAPMDDLYAQQEERMRAGSLIFLRRQRLWAWT